MTYQELLEKLDLRPLGQDNGTSGPSGSGLECPPVERGPVTARRITITPEVFEEAFPLTFSKKNQKVLIVMGEIIFLAGFAALLIAGVADSSIFLGLPLMLMGLVILVWGFRMPKQTRKKKYKALCSKNGGNPVSRIISLYPDKLEVETGAGAPVSFDAEAIDRVEETEHLYVIFAGKQAVMMGK